MNYGSLRKYFGKFVKNVYQGKLGKKAEDGWLMLVAAVRYVSPLLLPTFFLQASDVGHDQWLG